MSSIVPHIFSWKEASTTWYLNSLVSSHKDFIKERRAELIFPQMLLEGVKASCEILISLKLS